MRFVGVGASVLLLSSVLRAAAPPVDSDHDGLSDQVEALLLAKFTPTFMIAEEDCSAAPAEFVPNLLTPRVAEQNGAIYGQVFPKRQDSSGTLVEIHYYHLWTKDCGQRGHPLDAEHVSVLVQAGGSHEDWKALYWYAGAHEDTLCDASQMAKASSLHAEDHGATIWISEGKHASFLDQQLCPLGCGGDACMRVKPLPVRHVINLGEAAAPLSGAAWIASPQWRLRIKMQRSDFSPAQLQRVKSADDSDIVWASPGKRPIRATIGAGNASADAIALSFALSDQHAGSALSSAESASSRAFGRSLRSMHRALGLSFHGATGWLRHPESDSSTLENPKAPGEVRSPLVF